METKLKHLTSIISCSLGNILEWYDFGLFTIFSPLFSKLFFPQINEQVAMIATFSVFAVGFICRPLGALIFGYFGDKKGRAQTLRISILMISLPTLLIAFIPTYKNVGVLAPFLLTIMRMWQGISIGGEYSGNLIYLAESAPAENRAFFTSFAATGANLGILFAAMIGIMITHIFNEDQLQLWGWRIAYLMSGIFCLWVYKYRLRLSETAVFKKIKQKKLFSQNPIKVVFEKNLPQVIKTIGLSCMGSAFYYFTFIFIPVYLKDNLFFSVQQISFLMSLLISLMLILTPISGYVCDLIGRRKMMLFNSTVIFIIIIPGFYLLHINYVYALPTILLLFTAMSSAEQGATGITIIENFPPPARYTGVALGYNISNGFIGGTVPIVCGWLISFSPLWASAYIALCALITGLIVLFFVPETEHRNLAIDFSHR